MMHLLLVIYLFGVSKNAKIEGKVKDAITKEPLANAFIWIQGTNLVSSTDEKGDFVILDVPPGRYKIIISRVGYKSTGKQIEVKSGEILNLEFYLKGTPIVMEEVVVTGTMTPRYIKDVPIRTEVISGCAIEEAGAKNIYEALECGCGLRVETRCSYCNFSTVRLLGLGPDHTQILINGQPVYSGLASVYGLQQLGTADIERIEIVKGAGSALYGAGAIAGAINIITKKPSLEPIVSMSLEIGAYNTNNYEFYASKRKNNTGLILTMQYSEGDAVDVTGEKGKEPDGFSDRVKTRDFNAGFNLSFYNLLKGELNLRAKTVYEYRQGGCLTGEMYENPFTEGTERIITQRYELELNYKKRFYHGNEFNFSWALTFHKRNATNDAFLNDYKITHHDSLPPVDEMIPYLADENICAFNINYLHPVFKTHRILVGAQYFYNKLRESGKYISVDKEDPNYGIPYISQSKKHAHEFGLYFQDEFYIHENLEIVGGIRYDIHKSEDNFRGSGKITFPGVPPVKYKEESLNPRFAFRYRVFNFFNLRGSIGTGFRVPYGFSEDLHLCSGSPRVWKGENLKPERSISFNLSLDYEMEKISFSVNIFQIYLRDKIGFTEAGEKAKSLGYTYEWKNIDNAWTRGLEIYGVFSPVRNLIFEGSFNFNQGEYENPREDWIGTPYEKESKYISRFPQLTGNIRLKFIPPGWKFVLNIKYEGSMYIDYYENEEVPAKIKKTEPYWIFDGKISKFFSDKFEVYIGGKNLFDFTQPERHLDDAAFIYAPLIGRIIYGGLRMTLK